MSRCPPLGSAWLSLQPAGKKTELGLVGNARGWPLLLSFLRRPQIPGPRPTALPHGIHNRRGARRRRAPLKINRPRPGAAEKLFANSKLLQSRTVESWISCGSATETQNRQPSPQNGSRAVIFGAISPFRDKWKLLQKHFEFLTNQSLRMALARTRHEREFLRGREKTPERATSPPRTLSFIRVSVRSWETFVNPGKPKKMALLVNGQIVHPGP